MKINDFVIKAAETPWKAVNEGLMILLKIPVYLYVVIFSRVRIGIGSKFYGFPVIFRHAGSRVEIGDHFEDRNWLVANPLGVNHPTIICTWKKGASIKIGNDVGISGGSIVAAQKVEIGDGTLIGANVTIIDTDFHPVASSARRYDQKNIKSRSINIGKNVFIGMNAIILKGVTIPDNSVVPAGSVVRKWAR